MHNYHVVDIIGEGAYGVVLKAKSKAEGITLAIKKFKETDNDELIKKTTVRELKVLKSLRHKNIVELNEAFREKGLVHLVFEYLDNNLLEVLEKNPRGLPNKLIARYMYQVLEGLEYMHSLNYIHRDIKPENLLVNTSGTVKICDMGFARLMNPTMTDYVATRWYRPPELLIGAHYGPEIDIWAVGCIMAELSDTQPLFPGADEFDQLQQILSTFGPLPDSLKSILEKNSVFKSFLNCRKLAPTNFLDKYRSKLSEQGVQVLKMMLQLDPKKRITAKQALQHPYFDFLKPRQRFQKTSHAWVSNRMTQQAVNTERNRKISNNLTSLESIELEEKQNVLKKTKQQFFKFGKKNCESEEVSQEMIASKHTLGVNKIYRNKNEKKKYLGHVPLSEKEVRRSGEKPKLLKTLVQFKISQKKREGSTYVKNH